MYPREWKEGKERTINSKTVAQRGTFIMVSSGATNITRIVRIHLFFIGKLPSIGSRYK